MKKVITLLLCLGGIGIFNVSGQDQERNIPPEAKEKIETARIALLSDRLNLTTTQAEKFWPVYREFTEKRKALKSEFNKAKKEVETVNGDTQQQQRLIDLGLEIKQKELNLEKEYSSKILQVITPQQLLSLKKAEQEFRKLILEQLQQRRNQQQRKENFRDKNQRLREN